MTTQLYHQHVDERTMQRRLGAYRSQAVETASPARLVSLLYQGALKQVSLAEVAIEVGSVEAAHEHLIKAQAIVTELSASLNMAEGGLVADQLASLYDYVTSVLVEANVKKDADMLGPAVEVLRSLSDSWDEMTGELFAD